MRIIITHHAWVYTNGTQNAIVAERERKGGRKERDRDLGLEFSTLDPFC